MQHSGPSIHEKDRYVPALGYRWLTPLYDSVVALTSREAVFKGLLLEQADLKPAQRVLDLACGTGTLALMAKRRQPSANIVGLDGDANILEIARSKARNTNVDIEFRQGLSDELPFSDHLFDCALSSLFFHHLQPDQKEASFHELARVLRPGGELHVADWGAASGAVSRVLFYPIQFLDGFSNTADHVAGLFPGYFERAGFRQVQVRHSVATMFGNISLFSARAPTG